MSSDHGNDVSDAKVTSQVEELDCPACKIIIDYSSLQAAGAALEKHAYGAWVAVRHGYESGAFSWADIKDAVYEVCEMAEKVNAFVAKSEAFIRGLAERKPV